MKNASPALINALKNDHTLKALPKLVAEWNLNRYFPVTADNTPSEDSEGFDIEMFPIESIYKPNRPTKGIAKARVNSANVVAGYTNPRPARFYVADYDDQYKYWSSPNASDAAGVLVGCSPFIQYGQDVGANKLVVKFENSWATPKTFSVEIRTGSTWTSVFTQANVTDTTWKRKGELALYFNGTAWSQNKPATESNTKVLNGVRVNVTALEGGVQEDGTVTRYSQPDQPTTLVNTTGANSHCDVIEISARLERDLSDDLISEEDTFDMGEASQLYPIGTVTTNDGSVTLWNGTGNYSADNPNSPYKDLLEPNVELRLSYVYDLGGGEEEVNQFKLYADGWDGQNGPEVTVALKDYSKFFQEIKPRPAMWEGLTVPQIIYRVLDSIGFSNYYVTPSDAVTDFVIPVFWVDGEQSMWEVLDELAKASQTAIYFNGEGVLQIKTRDAALNDLASPDYYLRGKSDPVDGLANISELDQTTEFEGNSVKVSYATTKWSEYNNGNPTLQTVWAPEDTTALRSAKLQKAITTTTTGLFYIGAGDAKFWQYSGLVQIDAETIRYEGKEFAYYTYVGTTGTRKTAIVKSAEEQEKFNQMTPEEYRSRNALTGGMMATKRGEFDTTAKTHSITPQPYQTRSFINGVRRFPSSGLTHYPTSSRVQLVAKAKTGSDLLMSGIGATGDTGYYFYGTRMRIVNHYGQTDQRAGLFFHNDGSTQENGYYLEVRTTNKVSANRAARNELVLYNRKGGRWKLLTKGARVPVTLGVDFDIDLSIRALSNGNHFIRVWYNGQLAFQVSVSGADRCATNGRWGMYVLGRTSANWEYIYAMRNEEDDPPDDFSFLDKKAGGYVSDLWNHRWVYRVGQRTRVVRRKSTKINYRRNEAYFDEFGPYVHEIREFDVKFDPFPVLHSRLFNTNEWNSTVLEYHGNPFGAKFTIANTSRITAILNGEDTLTFPGSEDAIDQQLAVYGRPLVIEEAKEYEVKNDLQIQRRGPIEVELASPWIQSEAMAKEVGDWVLKHMSYGNDQLSVTIFGNPLIEVADVVHVKYPRVLIDQGTGEISQRMDIDDKYFVTGVNNNWENGIVTQLTLRKAPTA